MRYVYLGFEGETTAPFLRQLADAWPEDVKVQSKSAWSPRATTVSLGG